jgi:probable F420-dependent oxidoreductase
VGTRPSSAARDGNGSDDGVMDLSGTGVWTSGLGAADSAEATDIAVELEELGYTSLWIPSGAGRSLDAAQRLLDATRTITLATGILSIWSQTPAVAAAADARIRERHHDRFLLGIGVSHSANVGRFDPDAVYERPMAKMVAFLDGLDAAHPPVDPDHRVLAALGPKMLDLAASRAAGAHPYNVTPEHTAVAREHLGPSKLLVPEQAVVLATDAEDGRRIAREFLQHYLGLPNYANNLRRLGFGDDDLADGGSDRLIDAVVAWGDESAIAVRVAEHVAAGADSVCIQVLVGGGIAGMTARPIETWRALAPALT